MLFQCLLHGSVSQLPIHVNSVMRMRGSVINANQVLTVVERKWPKANRQTSQT